MTLLPGVMITNFMREIIVGDWLTGITKLVEALLIATASPWAPASCWR